MKYIIFSEGNYQEFFIRILEKSGIPIAVILEFHFKF